MGDKRSPAICTPFIEMLQKGEHCDVTLRVDGVEFSAHKIILSSCSDYFRTLFSSRWNKTDKRVHELHGFSAETLRHIIEYIYTGTVQLTVHNVQDLLITADYLSITGLIRLCADFLKSQLSLANCLAIWRFTNTCCCPSLRDAAFLFILRHFKQLTEVSTELEDLSVSELIDIIGKCAALI